LELAVGAILSLKWREQGSSVVTRDCDTGLVDAYHVIGCLLTQVTGPWWRTRRGEDWYTMHHSVHP
jgi:hypothetical protein